jgi:Ser/Thr protein kinase RdoA (MazF antagonist)
VGHHGDYWSGNVFVADRRVDVIDFEGFRDGLPLEDVAYFLVHLEQYFAYPFFGGAMPHLTSAFLDGYRGGSELDDDVFRLCTIAKSLQLIARGGGAERGWIRDELRRRALRRSLFRALWRTAE